jgi:hypothetical protein
MAQDETQVETGAGQSSDIQQKVQEAATPTVSRQPDGPGLRTGVVAEFTMLAPVLPGGADKFRANLETTQGEAAYYEGLIGTVHDLRIVFINNDTQMLFAATFDGDLVPYVADVFAKATPWLDAMFLGVLEGYAGGHDPGITDWVAKRQIQADLWYASNPTSSVNDVAKGQKVMQAFDVLLDAASS